MDLSRRRARIFFMDQTYRLKLDDEGPAAPLVLNAGTPDAARRQALQFAGDLLRDRARKGPLDRDLSLELTGPDDRLVYRISVSCSARE